MKDLTDVKLKQLSEESNLKMINLKQVIDKQLSLFKDNLIKSEDMTQEILQRVEKSLASKIQEVKNQTQLKIGQH
jgi:hypothetical protein